MKHVLDPEGLAIDLAAAPLCIEHASMTPAKKRVDLITSRFRDGAMPFGKAPADAMTITYKVRVDEQATMDAALAILREVSQLLDEAENQLPAGLPLEITPDGSVHASTAYVLVGEVSDLPQEMTGADVGWYHQSPVATITLLCEPFYDGPEEVAAEVEGEGPVLEAEIPEVKGDVDAPALAIITDKAGVAKRHYELGLESRFYDHESPAPILIEGDKLDVEGFNGTQVAPPAGAHSAKVVESALGAEPVVVCSTGYQPHIGQWQEKVRFLASSTNVYVRLGWRIGDGSWGYATGGGWVQASEAADWLERFLDTVNIPPAAVGGQGWEGRIEAYSMGTGDTIKVDYLECIPAERWMKVRAPTVSTPPAQLAAAAAGSVENNASAGGEGWTNPAFAAVSDGNYATFSLFTSGEKRSSEYLLADFTGFVIPKAATILGLALDVGRKASREAPTNGVVTDLAVRVVKGGVIGAQDKSSADFWPIVEAVKSYGSAADLWGLPWTAADINEGLGFALRCLAKTGTGAGADVTASVNSMTATVYYAETPETPFVCAATRDLRIDHEAAERYDTTGTYLARVPERRGQDFYLPPSGARGRRVRVVSKARSNDVDAEPDSLANSKHKLLVTYRPRHRFPRSA